MTHTKVNLTWGQFIWIIGTIAAVLLTWGDMKVAVARLEARISVIERQVTK